MNPGMDPPVYTLRRGKGPLLVSMPHVGTHLPDWLAPRLTEAALTQPDTDWALEALYDFLDEFDATLLVATHTRYVVDLNRDPLGVSLYPGQSTTGLCPLDTFGGEPAYQRGMEPDAAEVAARVDAYWRPYHDTLAGELERLRILHGVALLWDAHSIRSRVPRFFEGELPHFSLGTADHAACDPGLADRVAAAARGHMRYSTVVNGRFKGGYITRHYGKPQQGVHALQLELAQRAYMHEQPPYEIDAALAAEVRPALRAMLQAMLGMGADRARSKPI
jgi:N-formylglutamate deformylase